MSFIEAFIFLAMILSINLLIIRIATVALIFTGMSREMARFQARSAFCTVGFTTAESESIVKHPVRRQIVMFLMLAGNAGFVGVVVTAATSLQGKSDLGFVSQVLLVLGLLAGLWAVAMSRWVDNALFKITGWALRRFTRLDAHDYLTLLGLDNGYMVSEAEIEPGDWLVGQPFSELRLNDVGINVLSIVRADGSFVGTPGGATVVQKGDRLIVYGASESIIALEDGKSAPDGLENHRRLLAAKAGYIARKTNVEETQCGQVLTEIKVAQMPGLAGKTLSDGAFQQNGVVVLGIRREDGTYISSPAEHTPLKKNDKIVCFGMRDDIRAAEKDGGMIGATQSDRN